MSASDALLIFLGAAGDREGWLSLSGGRVVARGGGDDPIPAATEDARAPRIAAIVPGESVAMHWLEVPPGLAPLQAAAAARIAAAEFSAAPLADMHVAVGPEAEGEPVRPVAIAPASAMAGWIGALQADGLDPDIILPEPLLIAAPEEGYARFDRGVVPLWRGRSDAFALEPDIAALVTADAPVVQVDRAGFEDGLADAVAAPPVNLRQGAFAQRKRWQIDWAVVRRLALIAAGILLLTLAIQIAAILRYSSAADRLEADLARVAETAAPGAGAAADPGIAITRRLADLRGAGLGYGALSTILFDAIRATPNAELQSLTFDRDGTLRAAVQGDSDATLAALQDRIRAGGLTVEAGDARTGGGRQIIDITVRGS